MFSYIILALSSSIDSLGIGISYGIRKTKIKISAKLLLFFLSIFITSLSIYLGNILAYILPEKVSYFIGSFILIIMGGFIIYQIKQDIPSIPNDICIKSKKTYKFIINWLGITIHIIKNSIYSDLDNSNYIDLKESIYLGIALSLDSLCIGIGCSIIGLNSFLFPILVSTFQILFLSIGRYIGEKVSRISFIPENIWNMISGILLIFIGIIKLFL